MLIESAQKTPFLRLGGFLNFKNSEIARKTRNSHKKLGIRTKNSEFTQKARNSHKKLGNRQKTRKSEKMGDVNKGLPFFKVDLKSKSFISRLFFSRLKKSKKKIDEIMRLLQRIFTVRVVRGNAQLQVIFL